MLASEDIDASERILGRDVHRGLVPAILAFYDPWGASNVHLDAGEHRRALGNHLEALLQVVIDDERELPDLQINVLDALGMVFLGGFDANVSDLLREPKFVNIRYQS